MIKSIVIDTFTAFQKNDMLDTFAKGTASHNDWKEYGTEIILFIRELQKRGFTCIGILGYEGSGKSYIMKTLPKDSNIWFNSDGKNPTWQGGREEYGTKINPTRYMIIPKTYGDVIGVIDQVKSKNQLDPEPIAFLMAHIEDYKSADGKQRQRLKTLGKLPNKLNIEDMFEMCYYTDIAMEAGKPVYRLRTNNSGSDTCRTMEGLHDSYFIPNDGNLILKALDAYK